VAGPLNRGAERWWAMVVMVLAALDAFFHQNVYNAIAKAFTEEESNIVNKEMKKRDQPRKEAGAIPLITAMGELFLTKIHWKRWYTIRIVGKCVSLHLF
jgi:carbon starvation protein CstA